MTLALFWGVTFKLTAQPVTYVPDLNLGHRSFTYLHTISYSFNDKIRINNLTLLDTEYQEDKNNIFFIRNTVSFSISQKIALNAAVGIKNPGSFLTASAQYRVVKPTYWFAYSLGTTYQRGFTLEQAVSFDYSPYLTQTLQLYFNLLAIANVHRQGYQRGLQFVRLGLKQQKASYGFALNLDQFNNNTKTLQNAGLFIKYHF
ncbi:hypothetical protein HNQ92_002070 [Rhabdobacter roseus]|uniref:DUF2490 domain-containing protein n=1 Tax=Rhabdobacter roseus TaxID=1655419 RepID=A0A840TQE1_9BACT|nr:hypothetical protein [Rhabdobacter roseus]MBB5283927.1 hypothetical protein [Rhabdobacter roseus]